MRGMRVSIGAVILSVLSLAQTAPRKPSAGPKLLSSPVKEPKAALVVGINDYQEESGLSKLHWATLDAQELGQALHKQGYDYEYLGNERATGVVLRSHLKRLADRYKNNTGTIVFAFSGHGGQGTDGKPYLALWESDGANLKGTGISVEEIQSMLSASGARQKMLFLDACRNDPPAGVKAEPVLRPMQRIAAARGIRILNATAPGGRSWEYPEIEHGIFTQAILEGISGKDAKGPDGIVTFNRLSDYVEHRVENYTKSVDNAREQIPYASGEATGDLYVAGQPGTRRALVFGNQNYPQLSGDGGQSSLLSSLADARNVAAKVKELGFEVEPPVLDAPLEEMNRAIKNFAGKIQDEDAVLIYFSGAGGMEDGDALLLSADARVISQDQLRVSGKRDRPLQSKGLRLTDILSGLHVPRFGPTIVVTDMCLTRLDRTKYFDPRKIHQENTLLLFATDVGAFAFETDEGGIFTTEFIKLLAKPETSTATLARDVSAAVYDAAQRIGEQQYPRTEGQLNDVFFFNPLAH